MTVSVNITDIAPFGFLVRRLRTDSGEPASIATALGVSRATVYRAAEDRQKNVRLEFARRSYL